MAEELLTIGQVARRLGTSVSTLRYYDERGLVTPRVRAGGQRRYGPAEVRRLAFIRMWQETGLFSLDDLGSLMNPGSRADWRRVARGRIAELEERVAAARAAQRYIEWMLRCSRPDITECPVCGEDLDAWLASRVHDEKHDHPRDENPSCAMCRAPLPVRGRGRPRVYCSAACRQRAYREGICPSPRTTGKPVADVLAAEQSGQ
ncbi:MerR family transcriptional regulator [Actinomadura roseirufa]|uniref:MerR family transcriptional regulator n=1 Tax=Actinomadura roseirufa TaxID=2094049 RepID=UPI0010416056|nr:MerR family transcriptional regulator [Actinomadura roseirufa]